MKTRNMLLLAGAAYLAYAYRSDINNFISSFGTTKKVVAAQECSPPFSIIGGKCTMVVNCPPGVVC